MTERIAFTGKVEAEGRRLRGEVVLAGARTFRNGEFVEVDPIALMKADATGLFASWEHDDMKPLASTTNGSLRVTRTETGFTYETDELPNTTYANDGLELIQQQLVGGTSFEIEGARSSFTTDPETGIRVRRFTSIKRLRQVGPVRDPAFTTSSTAAFNKESDVTDIIEEPVAAPTPKPEPAPAKFTQVPAADDVFTATEAFARTLDTGRIEQAMDGLMAEAKGDLRGDNLRQYEAYAKVYGEMTKGSAEESQRAARMKLMHDIRLGRAPKAPSSGELFRSDDYINAFAQYLRSTPQTFSRNTANMEQFAQTVAGDGTQGGFTVPDGFLNRVTTRLKAFGGIAGVSDEITTSTGESLRWPSIDDTANKAAIATEGVQVASGGADAVFGSIELGAFEYDATGTGNNPLEVSLALLQDSAVDIETRISDLLATRIGRKQADDLATGAGSTAPVGLLTKSADVMTATVVSLAGPEHVLQVDAEYRRQGNCRWIFSDTTLLKIMQSQTTTNEPLFLQGGNIAGAPFGTFIGYPITIDPGAGTKVAFGDFKAGYIVRRVRGIQLLVDPYSTQKRRTVAYHAWARMDANVQDAFAYSVSEWSTVNADS